MIDVAVLGFNHDTRLVQGWHPVSEMEPVQMSASGGTDISMALHTAVQMVRERCLHPSYAGNLYKPVIVLITDGCGGDVSEVAKVIQRRIEEKKLQLWILCAKDYDKETTGNAENVYQVRNKKGSDLSILSSLIVQVTRHSTDVIGRGDNPDIPLEVDRDQDGYVCKVEEDEGYEYDESIS